MAEPVRVVGAEPQVPDELRQNQVEPVDRRERVIEQLAGRAPGLADQIGKLPARAKLDGRQRRAPDRGGNQSPAPVSTSRRSTAHRQSPVSITSPLVHAWI